MLIGVSMRCAEIMLAGLEKTTKKVYLAICQSNIFHPSRHFTDCGLRNPKLTSHRILANKTFPHPFFQHTSPFSLFLLSSSFFSSFPRHSDPI